MNMSIILVLLLLTVSCGGGSSSDDGGSQSLQCGDGVDGSISIAPCVKAGAFSYFGTEKSNRFVVRYMYPRDLDKNGFDEVIFAGFESQPNTPDEYTNTRSTRR